MKIKMNTNEISIHLRSLKDDLDGVIQILEQVRYDQPKRIATFNREPLLRFRYSMFHFEVIDYTKASGSTKEFHQSFMAERYPNVLGKSPAEEFAYTTLSYIYDAKDFCNKNINMIESGAEEFWADEVFIEYFSYCEKIINYYYNIVQKDDDEWLKKNIA